MNLFRPVFLTVLFLSSALFFYGCGRAVHPPVSAEKTVYQCSMHPKITSEKPGDCPICGMRLTRVDHGAHTEAPSGMDTHGRMPVNIDPVRQQQIGVKIAESRKMPLEMRVRALGRVAYDPDLHNTIGEYREAVAEYLKSKRSPTQTVRERGEQVMKLAELKLKLSGISAEQMEHLRNVGQSTLRLVTLRHTAEELTLPAGAQWVYFDLYENESGLAAPGQEAVVTTSALPGKIFDGKVVSADLIPNAAIRTVRARMEVMDPEALLREGMSVDVVLHASLGEKLAVPSDAIVNTGERSLVFVSLGDGKFEPREVRTGYEAGDFHEIVSGLTEGEKVAGSANFLIDSESRIRAALQNFGETKGAHNHG